jgi:hypothetical protein
LRPNTASPLAHRALRRVPSRIAHVLVLGVVATLLAACGGSSGTAAPTRTIAPLLPLTTPGPAASGDNGGSSSGPGGSVLTGPTGALCKAITTDEIASIFGSAVATTEGSDEDCSWTLQQLAVIDFRLEDKTSTDLGLRKTLFPGGRDVSGVGDGAYWASSVSVLYATHGGKTYAVQLVLFGTTDDQKNLDAATQVMLKAFSRI